MTLTILENRFDIIFRSGRRAGERLSLHRKSAALGRAPENDVHLDDPSVSRHHATIYQLGGVWMIRDEGSSRGTYLNYHMLNGPTRLRDRDVLMLGCLELEICDSKRVASPVEQPAPSPQQECSATNARHTWKRAALCSVLSCTATAAIAYTYVEPVPTPI
ncbi:MAG: pSer/pThr/pTyr-binding forkhead associated (FHA) protein [Verrucomicrobiales bacterium]|jgi:pSer/pThr/pTyr-binding forkhead associated (FHA) protein